MSRTKPVRFTLPDGHTYEAIIDSNRATSNVSKMRGDLIMPAFHAYVVYGGSEKKMAQAIIKANKSAANYKPKYDHGENGKTGMQLAIDRAQKWKNNHFLGTLGLISVELINDTCDVGKSQHEAPKTEEKSLKDPLITAAKKDLSKEREKTGGKWSGRKGGEGTEHLNLKNYIANNLETVFNEEGIQVIEVEYTFSSGDRADILLKDRYGRVIGLEVETEVKGDAYGMAGVLQAIKYLFMGALTEKVSYADSRSFLVAYSISPEVKGICKKYEVETIEISKEVVINWAK